MDLAKDLVYPDGFIFYFTIHRQSPEGRWQQWTCFKSPTDMPHNTRQLSMLRTKGMLRVLRRVKSLSSEVMGGTIHRLFRASGRHAQLVESFCPLQLQVLGSSPRKPVQKSNGIHHGMHHGMHYQVMHHVTHDVFHT